MGKFAEGQRVRHEDFGDGTVLTYVKERVAAVHLDADDYYDFDDTCTFLEDELEAIE